MNTCKFFIQTTVTRRDVATWYDKLPVYDNFIANVILCPYNNAKLYQIYYDVSGLGIIDALDDFPSADSVTLYYNPEAKNIMSVVNRPSCDSVYKIFPVTREKTISEY